MRDHGKGGALTEVTYFILLSLFVPNHGYGIMQFIKQKTQGRLVLGAGTLYGAINALLDKGWIKACDYRDERKKEYIITIEGEMAVQKEYERLVSLIEISKQIMEEKI